MCCGLCCNLLYRSRCCFWKLLPILWIIDLALTIYLVVALYQADIFACCTTNVDPLSAICGYDDLGGASNVMVNEFGYCKRIDDDTVCNQIGLCGDIVLNYTDPTNPTDDARAFGEKLCSASVRDDVATYNYYWLNGVLITKCVGLLFLLLLECNTCLKKIDQKDKEAEEAEAAEKCFKCKQWGKACCTATLVFVLKIFFIVFGTIATIIAIYYMQITGYVWTSRCDALDSSLKGLCETTEEQCNGGDNYYAVVFDSLELASPYWVDLISNVLHSVMWVVRIAVMRYAMKSTHLTSV